MTALGSAPKGHCVNKNIGTKSVEQGGECMHAIQSKSAPRRRSSGKATINLRRVTITQLAPRMDTLNLRGLRRRRA